MPHVMSNQVKWCEGRGAVVLSEVVRGRELAVVTAEPFVGDLAIPLGFSRDGLQVLATYLHHPEDSFATPKFVNRLARVPEGTFFLLAANAGRYTALFCLSHSDQVCSLAGTSDGLELRLRSGTSRAANNARAVLVAAERDDPYTVVADVIARGLEIAGSHGKLLVDKGPPPPCFGALGWCSLPALGGDVSHDRVLDAIWSLKQKGVQVGFVTLDEGWQHLRGSGRDPRKPPAMVSFDADPVRFPKGLRGLCRDLQRAGVEQVGVWHGMMGYRGGVHHDLARRYGLPPDRRGCYFPGYDLGKTFEFYHDYYSYLREQGVTFVKVGDQGSAHRYCRPGMDVTRLYENLHTAIQAAASIQFQSAPLNTECLRGENLGHWNSARSARAAADIDVKNPVGPMRSIRNNVSNALWLQHLMQPDVDAWTTYGHHSETLAIFHAVAGTFVTVADDATDHDIALLHRVILPDGRVPRADQPLLPCRESLFTNPLEHRVLYKTFTRRGDSGVVAVFNLVSGKGPVTGTVSAADVEGLQGSVFAVYSHRRGFLGVKRRDETIRVRIRSKEADIYTFCPVTCGVAVIGCYRLFLTGGPVTKVDIEDELVVIDTCATVPLLIYSECKVFEVRRNGEACPWEYAKQRHTLTIASRSKIGPEPATYTVSFEE